MVMSEWTRGLAFLDICVVYFALQLMRCVIFSIVLAGVVLLLRRCCFHRMVFAKGMLWPLFLLIPFLGKLKCFYGDTCFIKMSWWLTEIAMSHKWIDYIYMIGVVAVFVRIFCKRYRLRKMMAGMEKTDIGGRSIFVTDMRVTPFTAGLGVPKIVIPRTMIDSYSREEFGKYSHFGYVRRDDKLNKKLREEAAENAKKLVEKTREKAAKKKEELKETLEKAGEEVQQQLSEKVSHSESGEIYLDTDDMQAILEAVREKDEKSTGENTTKERVGIHLDMKL